MSSNNMAATIKCVIKTETYKGKTDMCKIDGGLLITPGHPIKIKNEWVYPKDVSKREQVHCQAFYNLVVDQSHIAIVNNVELILLGHNYTSGILKHGYYGTQRVINDLKQMGGYHDGLV